MHKNFKYFRVLLLTFCFITCLFFPCKNSAQINAEQVVIIGRNVLSMDDYMLAIQYFNQAIQAKPYLSDPYFYRAVAKLNLDDYAGAEADCTLAIERNKFKTEAYKVRGFARQLLGKDSLAIEDYDNGLLYNPLDKIFLYYKAIALTETNKMAEADSTFSMLLRQYPRFDDGFTARARLNLLRGDTIASLQDIEKALNIYNGKINPYLLRAEIEWKRKNWSEAGDAMNAAISLKPELPDLYVNRAFVKYNLDDYFGAMRDYDYALQLDPENASALFNRALLRYEVKDLDKADEDLSKVISLENDNYIALFNRGLVRTEMGKNKEALRDFESVAEKYPNFYQVYYAMAEANRNLGNLHMAMSLYSKAEKMVDDYIDNPVKNPLQLPAIAAAETNETTKNQDNGEETEKDVMEKFNHLVTISHIADTQMDYNEQIKGRVQDRDVNVVLQPTFTVSLKESQPNLNNYSSFFRDLDDLNRHSLITEKFYITPGIPATANEEEAQNLFNMADGFSNKIIRTGGRPIDRLALGVVLTMLKNYDAAIDNLNVVLEADPSFSVALMARSFALYEKAMSENKIHSYDTSSSDNAFIESKISASLLQEAISDYDSLLALNPDMVFAWFNKGNIYYEIGDLREAVKCYDEAIRIDSQLGAAYFNRGLSYLRSGNKENALADLSKAGELGILPSYNILKRMQQ